MTPSMVLSRTWKFNKNDIVRHVKTGNLYRIVSYAVVESDLTPVYVYTCTVQRVLSHFSPPQDMFCDAISEVTFTRPVLEFEDGRFEFVDKAVYIMEDAGNGTHVLRKL